MIESIIPPAYWTEKLFSTIFIRDSVHAIKVHYHGSHFFGLTNMLSLSLLLLYYVSH